MTDLLDGVIKRIGTDAAIYAIVGTGLTADTDFSTTAASTSTVTMVTDQTAKIFPGMAVYGTLSAATVTSTVKSITSTLLTLNDAVLTTGAGALTALGYSRVYRASFPKGPTFPCAVVSFVSGGRLNVTHNKTTVKRARVQVTSFATGDDDAFTISELVGKSLDKMDNTSLRGAFVIRSDDQGFVPDRNLQAKVFLYHRDFLVETN